LIVGVSISNEQGDISLSPECRTVEELRAQANYLKKQIDEAVIDAEKYLPSAKDTQL